MTLPLSARLSQVLVAYTLEFDNAFERRMADDGFPGAVLSRLVWSSLVRFLPDEGTDVRALKEMTGMRPERLTHMLGCLERWRFVTVDADRPRPQSTVRRLGVIARDGWGSGRAIQGASVIRPTPKGVNAKRTWQSLDETIERRWRSRFGDHLVTALCRSLNEIASIADVALASLLSQVLQRFALEFDQASPISISLCAGVLRVVDEDGVRVRDLPALTGSSPETTAIGWLLRRTGCVTVTTKPGRGRIVAITTRGVAAQEGYRRLTRQVEREWIDRVGRKAVDTIVQSLSEILAIEDADGPIAAKGLVPSRGTTRAGDVAPALGLPDRPAELKRAREMAAQTQRFLANPAGALPHYPLWDMNRGFGP